jgi:UDP-N-acetylglucosamine 2-epimerase
MSSVRHHNAQQQQQQQHEACGGEDESTYNAGKEDLGVAGDMSQSRSSSTSAAAADDDASGYDDADDDGLLPGHHRRPHMDKGFKRLLKQLLKNFAADSRQRELIFPANLSAADRWAC